MRYFLILLTSSFFCGAVFSQDKTAEDSVKTVVNTMFAAMKNADAASFRSVFADSAIMQTIARNREGKQSVVSENVNEFAEFISHLKKDSADERIRFETIKIDGPLAIVWTPYNFFFNG